MRALVVGANGFIGSHLVDALVTSDHDVRAFDRFSRDLSFATPGRVDVVVGDFLNQDDVARALRGVEVVFHFLSTSTPATAEEDPTFDIRTNIAPSVDLLRLSVEAGVKRVYFASSGGAVYGNLAKELCAEEDAPQPVSPYAIGKLAIENYLNYFQAKHGLESVALRISNPFGPRQHARSAQGIIPIVLRSIQAGRPVTQFGDGSMVRDYLYVEDLAEMVVKTVVGSPKQRAYNLGSGVGRSVTEIFGHIRDVVGADFEIEVKPTPATFVDRSVLDTRRYRTEFGATSLTDLRAGIERTWESVSMEGPPPH